MENELVWLHQPEIPLDYGLKAPKFYQQLEISKATSITNEKEELILDAGLTMGRSFRASFGIGFLLFLFYFIFFFFES